MISNLRNQKLQSLGIKNSDYQHLLLYYVSFGCTDLLRNDLGQILHLISRLDINYKCLKKFLKNLMFLINFYGKMILRCYGGLVISRKQFSPPNLYSFGVDFCHRITPPPWLLLVYEFFLQLGHSG